MQTIKKQRAYFTGLCLLSIAVFLTACTPPGPKALLKGKQLLEAGKYPQAIEQLKTATTLLPTNALAFNYLGLALHQGGQPFEAEKAYLRALSLNHELVEVRYNLGCLWLTQNKPEQAKAELTAFTLRRTNLPEGWLKLASAQLRTHEPAAAERSFGEVLRLKPNDPEALTGIGLTRAARNRSQEAAQFFHKALQQRPDYPPALLNLAIVTQDQLKDKKAALDQYRQYLALKPRPEDADQVETVVRQLQQELGPPAPVVSVPPVVTNSAPPRPVATATNNVKPAAELALASTSRPTAATTNTSATAAPKLQPKPEPPKSSNPAPATKLIAAAEPKTNPAATPAAITNHHTEPAPAAPLEVVNVPNDPVFKPAEDVTVKSATAAPEQAPATGTGTSPKKGFMQKLNPARLFSKDEKPALTASARENTSASAAPAPVPDPEPNLQSFQRYSYKSPAKPQAGNRSEAERAFAQGVQAQTTRHLADAITAYRRSVQADPSYYDAYYNLGLAYTDSANLPQALATYESALALRPESVDARYNFAICLKQANYPVDAANELQKLLSSHPNEGRAHLALGNLYDQQFKDPAKAKVHYLKVLETDPQNPEAGAIRYWLAAHPMK